MLKTIANMISIKKLLINALFVIFIIFVKASVFANYVVPTGSMNPTILEGDKIFANNAAYSLRVPFTKLHIARWNFPKRGDIIAFIYPGDNKTSYVKRVIGIPGDTVEIIDKKVMLNGTILKQEFIKHGQTTSFYKEMLNNKTYLIQLQNHSFNNHVNNLFKVPPGYLFVMGDNRDDSADSRIWGYVPLDNVLGKLGLRWFSWDQHMNEFRFDHLGLLE